MTDELVVRPGVEGDTNRIVELLKLSLGEGTIPRDSRYWEWKHFRNPFGVSTMLLAEARGQIVGLRVFMRWNWMRVGEEVKAVRAVDTATHPDWQGRGIFTRLTLDLVNTVAAEGISFVYNTPNDRSRPGYLKMGWSSVGKASLWMQPSRPLNTALSLWGRRGGESGSATEPLADEYSVADHLQEPGLERLLNARGGDRRFQTRITRDYLEWRYRDTPEFKYYAAGHWQEPETALIIFRLRPRGGLTELRLCEILTGPDSFSIDRAAQLIKRVVRITRSDCTVAMGAPDTPERRVLLKARFLPVPRVGPILTVRPLTANGEPNLPHWSAWRLAVGDLELF